MDSNGEQANKRWRRWTTGDEKEDEQIEEDDKFQLNGHRCVENQR